MLVKQACVPRFPTIRLTRQILTLLLSLCRYAVLEEMVSRGNLIAQFYSKELRQLDENLKLLSTLSLGSYLSPQGATIDQNTNSIQDGQVNVSPDFLGEWNSDDGLNGDQLMALANSLDFDHFDWVGSMGYDDFQSVDPMLPG